MFTPPPELGDDAVRSEVRAGWGILAASLAYRAVGFGSHHWLLRAVDADWFVTVDFEPDPSRSSFDELSSALRTARALADDGMRSIVAPLPTTDGAILRLAATASGRRYALSVFPYLEAPTLDEAGTPDPLAVVHVLADLHERTAVVEDVATRAVLDVPGSAALATRLGSTASPWTHGPYGERARAMIADRSDDVVDLLETYARVQATIDPKGWVITHGEPHNRNLLVTSDGIALIDWDTARIAPAARDLWHVGGPDAIDAYEALTGRAVPARDLVLYRARWDLDEIALYAEEFGTPHEDSDDTRVALEGLAESLGSVRDHLRRLAALPSESS